MSNPSIIRPFASTGDIIRALQTPTSISQAVDFLAVQAEEHKVRVDALIREVRKRCLIRALMRHEWNQSKAAVDLGMHRNTLRLQMRDLGIVPPNGRKPPERL